MELLNKILDYSNIDKAYKQVVANKGSKGVDGVTTAQLQVYMQENWERIKQEITDGHYQPQAVKGVEIPKTSGGKRLLGIPTVIDRLIQQSIHQVLNPVFDVEFPEFCPLLSNIILNELDKELERRGLRFVRYADDCSIFLKFTKLKAFTRGWVNYYKYAHISGKLKDLDGWVRNRLRYCIWKHWKKPNKRMRSFIRLGIPKGQAYSWSRSRMGGWAIAQSPMLKTTVTINRLKRKGYLSFSEYLQKSRRSVPNETQLEISFVW